MAQQGPNDVSPLTVLSIAPFLICRTSCDDPAKEDVADTKHVQDIRLSLFDSVAPPSMLFSTICVIGDGSVINKVIIQPSFRSRTMWLAAVATATLASSCLSMSLPARNTHEASIPLRSFSTTDPEAPLPYLLRRVVSRFISPRAHPLLKRAATPPGNNGGDSSSGETPGHTSSADANPADAIPLASAASPAPLAPPAAPPTSIPRQKPRRKSPRPPLATAEERRANRARLTREYRQRRAAEKADPRTPPERRAQIAAQEARNHVSAVQYATIAEHYTSLTRARQALSAAELGALRLLAERARPLKALRRKAQEAMAARGEERRRASRGDAETEKVEGTAGDAPGTTATGAANEKIKKKAKKGKKTVAEVTEADLPPRLREELQSARAAHNAQQRFGVKVAKALGALPPTKNDRETNAFVGRTVRELQKQVGAELLEQLGREVLESQRWRSGPPTEGWESVVKRLVAEAVAAEASTGTSWLAQHSSESSVKAQVIFLRPLILIFRIFDIRPLLPAMSASERPSADILLAVVLCRNGHTCCRAAVYGTVCGCSKETTSEILSFCPKCRSRCSWSWTWASRSASLM